MRANDQTDSEAAFFIDTSPLDCSLPEMRPLRIEMVCGSGHERLWDELVRRYHYLGYRKMVGCRLKYLVFHHDRPIAALGWRAAALKVEVRDRFIGWSPTQRAQYLKGVANNNRFLILPWVHVWHLASHLLSRMRRQLPRDWYARYGQRLFLLETFIDGKRFHGTSYKAANWVHVGQSKGYTKKGVGFIWHGEPKEVWLYVVDAGFRRQLGFVQREPSRWSPRLVQREGELAMMLRQAGWDPALMPPMDISAEDLEKVAEELVNFHQEFSRYYRRREQHRLGLAYLRGLMSSLERKTAEGIALLLLDAVSVRRLQDFITNYRWDHQGMLGAYQQALARLIVGPEDEGMLNVDSSEFVKKGTESVGVGRQYCGNLGKVENCQSGVFVGYASEGGYGLLDCQLFLPQHWFTEEYAERRKKCQIPQGVEFQTKVQIARQLIQRVKELGLFRPRWIGCDCTFGSSWAFLDEVGQDCWYFANVKSSTLVWMDQPRMRIPRYRGRGKRPTKPQVVSGDPVTAAQIAGDPKVVWRWRKVAEGAKGPIMAEVARLRVIPSREGLPGKECWLVIRKYPGGELKYALSNAPKSISFRKLTRAATLRWPIEQCFQEGKEQLGMDHYEHRSWPGWHRHMVFVFLAQLFLLRLRYKYKKKPNVDPSSGAAVRRSGVRGRSNDEEPSVADRRVLHREKPCCLEVPLQGAASPAEETATEVAPVERRTAAAPSIRSR
jgi:SRSO17 transposase